jgi:TRAP-type C4-dicarboxylate transport system substrate-binding protein
MKKLIILVALMVFLVSTVMACAEPAPAPTPAPSPAPAPTPAPSPAPAPTPAPSPAPAPTPAPTPEKVYHLKYNDWSPEGIGISLIREEWKNMVEERSGGRVKIDMYFSQSLLNYMDSYRGVQSGIADLGAYVFGTPPGLHPLNSVVSLPVMGWPGMAGGTKLHKELRKMYTELDEEFAKKGTKIIWSTFMPFNQLHIVEDKEARVPEDIKGMKIGVGSGGWEKVLSNIGTAAVVTGPPDWYMSAERGLIQGQILHWAAVYEFGLTELYKTHTDMGPGGGGSSPLMGIANIEVWNSLPLDIQEIFIDLGSFIEEKSIEWDVGVVETAHQFAREMGHPIYSLTTAEHKAWEEAVQSYHDEWIAETEAKGLPARKVYEGAKKLIAEYSE